MAILVRLRRPRTGQTRTGYVGFSWTSLFFSGIPAIIRGDVTVGLGVLAATIFLSAISLGVFGVMANIVWASVYNRLCTKRIIGMGYQIDDAADRVADPRSALGMA